MQELQRLRQNSQVFAGRHGFITLRDLFKWADRKPESKQQFAEIGFMLLAERVRKETEKKLIQVSNE
jgi:midasin